MIRRPGASGTFFTAARYRNRAMYALACLIAVLFGLASRRYPDVLPAFLGKYPGDTLWAVMVFFGWGLLRRRDSTSRVTLLALTTCLTVEVLKLYRAPWMIDIRHTMLGHLVFGHAFSAQNLVAYAVGVAVALGVEIAWPYAGQGVG